MSELSNEQINKLIHEKVFGECWHELDGGEYLTYCLKCKKYLGRTNKEAWKAQPNYSESIKDAFHAVEKVRHKYNFQLYPQPKNFWYVNISLFDDDYEIFEGKAETLSKAICLAILKAEGVEL